MELFIGVLSQWAETTSRVSAHHGYFTLQQCHQQVNPWSPLLSYGYSYKASCVRLVHL